MLSCLRDAGKQQVNDLLLAEELFDTVATEMAKKETSFDRVLGKRSKFDDGIVTLLPIAYLMSCSAIAENRSAFTQLYADTKSNGIRPYRRLLGLSG